MLLAHPRFYSVVAAANGEIIATNFMDERSPIVGIGPISVDPARQQRGVGRLLMEDVLARAAEQHAPGVRLVQAGYNSQSCTRSSASARANRYQSWAAHRPR